MTQAKAYMNVITRFISKWWHKRWRLHNLENDDTSGDNYIIQQNDDDTSDDDYEFDREDALKRDRAVCLCSPNLSRGTMESFSDQDHPHRCHHHNHHNGCPYCNHFHGHNYDYVSALPTFQGEQWGVFRIKIIIIGVIITIIMIQIILIGVIITSS